MDTVTENNKFSSKGIWSGINLLILHLQTSTFGFYNQAGNKAELYPSELLRIHLRVNIKIKIRISIGVSLSSYPSSFL